MSHHTWIHKLARVTIVRPLVGSSVRPNHITTLRMIVGITAAGALAVGQDNATIFGAIAFLISMLLDRADGDYARLTGQTSPQGHKYDLISDTVCNAAIFVGLGIGLRESEYGVSALLMGAVAGAAVAVILMLVIRIERLQGPRTAEIGNRLGFDADDAMLLVPIAILLGWSEPLLLAACVGAPAFAVVFVLLFRSKLRSPSTDGAEVSNK